MKTLKLILTLGLFSGVVMFSACGDGGAAEAAKKMQDSLRADSTMKADKAKHEADSISAAITAKHVADSIAAADSAAAAPAPKGGKGK